MTYLHYESHDGWTIKHKDCSWKEIAFLGKADGWDRAKVELVIDLLNRR